MARRVFLNNKRLYSRLNSRFLNNNVAKTSSNVNFNVINNKISFSSVSNGLNVNSFVNKYDTITKNYLCESKNFNLLDDQNIPKNSLATSLSSSYLTFQEQGIVVDDDGV
eukprot:TRINITY_DN13598_c0_g1_i1.p1 TRINITY_DN13598_c0_g1~~TRINITY_DN13598_c0_g1_i1.p1  ORF type:complete len:119 (+),score=13.94 TRINITY_DN13598_c0_g1_i1:28-357(+)